MCTYTEHLQTHTHPRTHTHARTHRQQQVLMQRCSGLTTQGEIHAFQHQLCTRIEGNICINMSIGVQKKYMQSIVKETCWYRL